MAIDWLTFTANEWENFTAQQWETFIWVPRLSLRGLIDDGGSVFSGDDGGSVAVMDTGSVWGEEIGAVFRNDDNGGVAQDTEAGEVK
jgi:hypothetical protein